MNSLSIPHHSVSFILRIILIACSWFPLLPLCTFGPFHILFMHIAFDFSFLLECNSRGLALYSVDLCKKSSYYCYKKTVIEKFIFISHLSGLGRAVSLVCLSLCVLGILLLRHVASWFQGVVELACTFL